MSKRILSAFLTIAMLIVTIDGTAYAGEIDSKEILPEYQNQTDVSENNAENLPEDNQMMEHYSGQTVGLDFADKEEFNDSVTDVISGTCGDNLTWKLENGVLTIAGTGDINHDINGEFPWDEYSSKITSIIIENGVTGIGVWAFHNFWYLESVSIPATVTKIQEQAFVGCANLPAIKLPENLTIIENGVFSGCELLDNLEIPDSVTSIGNSAFSHCSNMTSIKLSRNITEIANSTFDGCTKLSDITIPSGVTKIGDYAFFGCDGLCKFELPGTVTEIGSLALRGNGLTCLVLPASIEKIGRWAIGASVTDVYYLGSKEQWDQISFEINDNWPTTANVYYDCKLPIVCTISFDKQGGSGIDSSTTELLGKIKKPENPIRDGFVFCAWYKDKDYKEIYNFSSPVIKSFTLYAKWEKDIPLAATGNNSLELSNNKHEMDYIVWGQVANSYLFQGQENTYYRIIYCYDKISLEQFDQNGNFINSWMIPVELPIFGGFYAGKESYYFVFGQNNPTYSDEKEVIRIVKYSKTFSRVGAVSLYGANTFEPFHASGVHMDDEGEYLYIRTGHTMYPDENGLNHQANMTIIVNTGSMKLVDANYEVKNRFGYVSHSFQQFIKADGDKIVTADHGDGFPRGIVLNVSSQDGAVEDSCKVLATPGLIGDNRTGASLGGLEISKNCYLVAGNALDYTATEEKGFAPRNVFVAAVSKTDLSMTFRQISEYEVDGPYSATTPQLVKISDDLFAVMWGVKKRESKGYLLPEDKDEIRIALLDGDGNLVGDIQGFEGALSDCQPVFMDGRIQWFVTDNIVMKLYSYRVSRIGNAWCVDDFKCNPLPLTIATLGDRVDSIKHAMFMGCCNLKKVVTHEGIKGVEDFAFDGCLSLEEIRLPDSITEIGHNAFADCKSLQRLELPQGITGIGNCAFYGCSNLVSINIPESVTTIEGQAFYGCSKLKSIEIPGKVEGIALGTFNGCSHLEKVVLPDSVTLIDNYAFHACSNLKSIQIGRNLKIICFGAFSECSMLRDIYYKGNREQWDEIIIDENNLLFQSAMVHLNGTESDVMAGAPYADIEPGSSVLKGTKITLKSITEGAKIYYSTDPNVPANKGSLYTEPIIINKYTVIRAIAVKEGYQDSTVSRMSYIIKLEEDAENKRIWGDIVPEDRPDSVEKIPDAIWLAGIDENGYEYTGTTVKPTVRVYDGTTLLKAKKDYSITYVRNTKAYEFSENESGYNAGDAPAVIIKGKGNYSGTETKTFKILKKDITDPDVIRDFVDAYAVTSKRKNPVLNLRLKYRKKVLKKGKDYSFVVKDANGNEVYSYAAEGTYTLILNGTGANYKGECKLQFAVEKKVPVSKLKIKKISPVAYDGTEKRPEPLVKYRKTFLTKGKDYTLSYENNKDAGTAVVVITGLGEYFGTRKVNFQINGYPLQEVDFLNFENTVEYASDSVYQWAVVLLHNGRQLTKGTDYSVSYSNHLKVGKATAVYTGKGMYSGTVKKTFKIIPYSMAVDEEECLWIDDREIDIPYEKGGVKPHIKLYSGYDLLEEDKDYTLIYQNNMTAKSSSEDSPPTIMIKGKGNYTDIFSQKKTFTIREKNISEVQIIVSDVIAGIKSGKYTSVPTLTDTNGKTLKAGTDYDKNYTYTYKNQTTVKNGGADVTRAAGDAVDAKDVIPAETVLCVRVTAKTGGNYTGSATAEYRVTQSLITKAKITVKNPGQGNRNLFPYTGKAVTIDQSCLTVKVGDHILTNDEYEILEDTYKNNINRGTASVRIRGKGDYGGTATVKFNVGARGFRWFWRLFTPQSFIPKLSGG